MKNKLFVDQKTRIKKLDEIARKRVQNEDRYVKRDAALQHQAYELKGLAGCTHKNLYGENVLRHSVHAGHGNYEDECPFCNIT